MRALVWGWTHGAILFGVAGCMQAPDASVRSRDESHLGVTTRPRSLPERDNLTLEAVAGTYAYSDRSRIEGFKEQLRLYHDGRFDLGIFFGENEWARATGTFTVNSKTVRLSADSLDPPRLRIPDTYELLVSGSESYLAPAEIVEECRSRVHHGEGTECLPMLIKEDGTTKP